MFQIGDKVEWRSQANGTEYKKEGEIIRVIPSGVTLRNALEDVDVSLYNLEPLGGRRFFGRIPPEESYLVATPSSLGRRPKLYRPRADLLRKVE